MGPQLELVADALRRAGLARRCWLVGGAVRDELLGLPPKGEVDVVVEGDALEAAEALWQAGLADHSPAVYARFGTAMVRVQGVEVELATSRAESYTPGSRKPKVRPAPLEADALRRDFTVNALMRSAEDGRLADLTGKGLADLEARVLRCPGDPLASFRDDPLRMYRAVRFVHQLGFAYAEGLEPAVIDSAGLAATLSRERVRDEVSKILLLPRAGGGLHDLLRLGLLDHVSPVFRRMQQVGVGRYHHLDAWAHTCQVVEASPPDLVGRLAAWLHDVGKPDCLSLDEKGEPRFLGHEAAGEAIARQILAGLRFPGATVARVAGLVRGHMRLSQLERIGPAGLRRLVRDFGEDLGRLLDLVEADRSALRPGAVPGDLSALRARLAETARATPREALVSPLDGREIGAVLGIPPGPEVGAWKRALAEAVVAGEVPPGGREEARAWLLQRQNLGPTRPVSESDADG